MTREQTYRLIDLLKLPGAVIATGMIIVWLLSTIFETKVAHTEDLRLERADRTLALQHMEQIHTQEYRRIMCYLKELAKPLADRDYLQCEP